MRSQKLATNTSGGCRTVISFLECSLHETANVLGDFCRKQRKGRLFHCAAGHTTAGDHQKYLLARGGAMTKTTVFFFSIGIEF